MTCADCDVLTRVCPDKRRLQQPHTPHGADGGLLRQPARDWRDAAWCPQRVGAIGGQHADVRSRVSAAFPASRQRRHPNASPPVRSLTSRRVPQRRITRASHPLAEEAGGRARSNITAPDARHEQGERQPPPSTTHRQPQHPTRHQYWCGCFGVTPSYNDLMMPTSRSQSPVGKNGSPMITRDSR